MGWSKRGPNPYSSPFWFCSSPSSSVSSSLPIEVGDRDTAAPGDPASGNLWPDPQGRPHRGRRLRSAVRRRRRRTGMNRTRRERSRGWVLVSTSPCGFKVSGRWPVEGVLRLLPTAIPNLPRCSAGTTRWEYNPGEWGNVWDGERVRGQSAGGRVLRLSLDTPSKTLFDTLGQTRRDLFSRSIQTRTETIPGSLPRHRRGHNNLLPYIKLLYWRKM